MNVVFCRILWGVTGHIQNEEEEELTSADNNDYMTYFGFAIGSTVVTVLVIIMVIALRKRVKLVIQLFKEAGKAILSMPLLLFEPIIVRKKLNMTASHKDCLSDCYSFGACVRFLWDLYALH